MNASRVLAASLLALGVLSASAMADVVSERADTVTVTSYHSSSPDVADLMNPENAQWAGTEGLTLVSETRSVDLPAGESVIRFRGVASTIVPQTVDIEGLPSAPFERNFDYDLLGPGSLVAKSIGQTVHLVRTDPKTGKETEQSAIVRTGPGGVFLDVAGGTEALSCSGLPERLVFDKIPEGLTDMPTLSVHANVPAAGHYTLKLTYLMTGLQWAADYVAQVSADGRTMQLSGWITLSNASDTTFAGAPTEVVAGNIAATGDDAPVDANAPPRTAECWPMDIDWATYRNGPPPPPPPPPPVPMAVMAYTGRDEVTTVVVTGSRVIDPRLLGDYKLYPLPEPTTVAAHQTKQLQFLDLGGVTFDKIYFYGSDLGDDDKFPEAKAIYRFKNEAASGLGKPLPGGRMAFLVPSPKGELLFAGQGTLGDTAEGSLLEVEAGGATDIAISRRVVESVTIGEGEARRRRDTFEITVENDKSVPIHFELGQYIPEDGGRIVSETEAHVIKPGGAMWALALDPGEHVTIRYTVEYPG